MDVITKTYLLHTNLKNLENYKTIVKLGPRLLRLSLGSAAWAEPFLYPVGPRTSGNIGVRGCEDRQRSGAVTTVGVRPLRPFLTLKTL